MSDNNDSQSDEPGPPYPTRWSGDPAAGHASWCGFRAGVKCHCGFSDLIIRGTSNADHPMEELPIGLSSRTDDVRYVGKTLQEVVEAFAESLQGQIETIVDKRVDKRVDEILSYLDKSNVINRVTD